MEQKQKGTATIAVKKLTKAEKQMQDEKLTALALRIHRNEVFTSFHIKSNDMHLLPMIFLPLSLMDRPAVKKMQKEGAWMLYADYKDQMPRGINGYPFFGAFAFITKEEFERVIKMVDALKEAEKATADILNKI